MVKINRIQFINYRQYKNYSLDFNSNGSNNLHIIKAKNGTGKTTFLNGILWCLYGEEKYISNKNKSLPVYNQSILSSNKPSSNVEVSVILEISDKDSNIVFTRTQLFNIVEDPLNGNRNVISLGSSELKVFVTEKSSSTNSKVYEDVLETGKFVKKYFDKDIFDYYFFDGENLKDYFDESSSERIKSSVFSISQVTLLGNTIAHLNNLIDGKTRQISKIGDEDVNVYDKERNLEREIREKEQENVRLAGEIKKLQEDFEEKDSLLRNYAPVKLRQERREVLDKELLDLESQFNEFKKDQYSFIKRYLVLFKLYPRIKSTLNMINKKQSEGLLPPVIDRNLILDLVDKKVDTCPVCDNHIDEKALVHLSELLGQLNISTVASHKLIEIKSSLESAVDECKEYKDKKAKLISREKELNFKIEKVREELSDIHSYLSTYSNMDSNSINVSQIELDRNRVRDELDARKKVIVLNENNIEICREKLVGIRKDIENMEARDKNRTFLGEQLTLLRKLYANFSGIQNDIMLGIRDEIKRKTWQRFDSMIWKKKTFKYLDINDSYEISVYNMEGNEMTASMSATEHMALAYAFTFAIHDVSGINSPLVVDSPLGRVSDENRELMAKVLLNVSREKQIIMLFTPDEYSKNVANIFNDASSLRVIALDGNEKEVQEVSC